jgi:amidase
MLIPADPVDAFVDYPDVPVANAPAGPLAGLSFAVKDIFDVAGYPTGCGNPARRRESGPAKAHAPTVQRLLDAGARFVGKTHTAELAFSLDGRNAHYGTPVNRAAPGRVPGGSSSGSAAAVAARLCDFALGSDTGGSVRGPASFCGLVGLRPTFGRTDLAAVMPLAASFDTVGWFTHTVGLHERIAAVLLGADAAGPPLCRLIRVEDAFALLFGRSEADALAAGVAAATRLLGEPMTVRLAPEGLAAWQQLYRILQGFEAWAAHGAWIMSHPNALGPQAATRFEVSRRVTAAEAAAATEKRDRIREQVRGLVGADGVLVLPTMPGIALPVDAPEEEFENFRARAISMLCVSGLAGLPQVSLPVGTVAGCPLGLSLIGPPGRDRALLAVARQVLGE